MGGDNRSRKHVDGATGSVLVVEDSLEYVQGLERHFRGTFTLRTAGTVASAKRLLSAGEPFIGAIVDVRLPDGSGIDVVASIRRRGHSFPVLVVTAYFEATQAAGAQLHGAEFLPKGVEEPKHLDAFSRRVREHAVGPRAKDLALVQRLSEVHRLTDREKDIVAMTVADVPRADMAHHLGISPETLKSHVRSVLRKTRTRSIAELGSHLRRTLRGELPEDEL